MIRNIVALLFVVLAVGSYAVIAQAEIPAPPPSSDRLQPEPYEASSAADPIDLSPLYDATMTVGSVATSGDGFSPTSKLNVVLNGRGGLASIRTRNSAIVVPGIKPAMPAEEVLWSFAASFAEILGVDVPGEELVVDLLRQSGTGDSARTIIRFHQTLNGVPIHGCGAVVHVDSQNRVVYYSGRLVPSVVPTDDSWLPLADLMEKAPILLAYEPDVNAGKPVYFDADSELPLFLALTPAWETSGNDVSGTPVKLIIDANTGEILQYWATEKTANIAVNEYAAMTNPCQALAGVEYLGNEQYNIDTSNCCPQCQPACDPTCAIANCQFSDSVNAAIVSSDYVRQTWSSLHGWDGLDGQGEQLLSVVDYDMTAAQCGKWAAADDPDSCDAVLLSEESGACLNIVAHEFQHGVAWFADVLQEPSPDDQHRAVDEHLADVNGIVNEGLHGSGSWIMGDGSSCYGRRNVCDPTWEHPESGYCDYSDYDCDPPIDCESQPATWNDFGALHPDAVHFNNGIGNKLAWLLGAPEGTSRTWGGVQTTALGLDSMAQILFKAETEAIAAGFAVTYDTYRNSLEEAAEMLGPDELAQTVLASEAVGLWQIHGNARIHNDHRGAFVDTKDYATGQPYLWHFQHNPYGAYMSYERCGPGYDCAFSAPSYILGASLEYGPYAMRFTDYYSWVIYSRPVSPGTNRIGIVRVYEDSLYGPYEFNGIANLDFGPAALYAGSSRWIFYVEPSAHRLRVCRMGTTTCTLDYQISGAISEGSPAVIEQDGTTWLFWTDGTSIRYSTSADLTDQNSWTAPALMPEKDDWGLPAETDRTMSVAQAFDKTYMSYLYDGGQGTRGVTIVSFDLRTNPVGISGLSRGVIQNHEDERMLSQTVSQSSGALYEWGSTLWLAYQFDRVYFKRKRGW